ncbi:MAG: DegT/DnrJ/EryC1/StrS family aminotransferase, partial [Kiritimatiellae bacterium]|nr:DegT/DnrJ/EryC1/StrS family aminotransferase [Kiritimatiellia bacterium]
GNKIITTSGGGMLVSRDAGVVERARRRAQQAREPVAWYEHRELGYNYRMSNIVAAVGVGQLAYLEQIIAKKRQIFEWYRVRLEGRAVCRFMPEAAYGRCTRWLTVGLLRPRPGGELAGWNPAKLAPGSSGRNDECKSLDEADDRLMAGREGALTRPGMEALLMSGGFLHSCLRSLRLKRNSAFGRWSQKGKSPDEADDRLMAGRGQGSESESEKGCRAGEGMGGPGAEVMRVIEALERANIEARPVWKPMHLQPVFQGARVFGGSVGERFFRHGICLPSGAGLEEADVERVCGVVLATVAKP